MQIFITRGEDSSGPYTLEQVQDYLSQGVLLPDDFAYHEGLEDWMPLEQLISKSVPLEDLPHPAQMAEAAIPSKAEPVLAEVVRPPVKGKGKKKIVITVAACLLVVGVLGGVANFFLKMDPASEAQNKGSGKPLPATKPTTPIKVPETEPDLPPSPTLNPLKPESNPSLPLLPTANPTTQTGSLAGNIQGKRFVCQVPGNKEGLLQFEKGGVFNVAKISAGKISPEDDEMTYKVDGLKVRVTENGKENGGVSFPTDNPKIGDKILVGPEGRQAIWSILKIEPAASLGDTPPTLSKIRLGQMLFGLQQPLTDQEKLMVGRWKEFDMEEPDTPLSHLIFRPDRSFTYFTTYPAMDDEGNEIVGKTERLLAHGIWKIGDNRLNYLDLVHNGGKMEEPEVWINELKSLTRDGYRAEETFEGDTTKFRGSPVEKFAVPEMLPHNDEASLQSFDIRQAYNSAKGKGTAQLNIFFSKPPEPSNSKLGLPLPPLPGPPANPKQ